MVHVERARIAGRVRFYWSLPGKGLLGKDAAGIVYKAYDPVLQRTVAIKMPIDSDNSIAIKNKAGSAPSMAPEIHDTGNLVGIQCDIFHRVL